MPAWLRDVAQIPILAIGFFVIGLLTRMPALYFTEIYGLHAVFASPFYALLIAYFIQYREKIFPLVFAVIIYGLCLGAMQVVMAVGAIAPLLICVGFYFLAKKSSFERKALLAAIYYSATVYPATLLGGVLFGSYFLGWSGEQTIQIAILFLVSAGLGVLGALLGSQIAAKFQQKKISTFDHVPPSYR